MLIAWGCTLTPVAEMEMRVGATFTACMRIISSAGCFPHADLKQHAPHLHTTSGKLLSCTFSRLRIHGTHRPMLEEGAALTVGPTLTPDRADRYLRRARPKVQLRQTGRAATLLAATSSEPE